MLKYLRKKSSNRNLNKNLQEKEEHIENSKDYRTRILATDKRVIEELTKRINRCKSVRELGETEVLMLRYGEKTCKRLETSINRRRRELTKNTGNRKK